VLESSGFRYNAVTTGYKVEGIVDDNIYEPGEQIMIHSLTVWNNGGLTLPSGSLVTIPSTPTFRSDNIMYQLPGIHIAYSAPKEIQSQYIPVTVFIRTWMTLLIYRCQL
jgi:hypothetical protein